MIYAYEDKYDPQLKGILKVGYTTIGVQERVRQQYNIVRPGEPPYRILVEESAMRGGHRCRQGKDRRGMEPRQDLRHAPGAKTGC